MTTMHAITTNKPKKNVRKISKRKAFERKMREYRKFLRNDYDWDYIYILKLLKFKLERTRKCILGNDIIVEASKVAQEIESVEQLLDRVINDDMQTDQMRKQDLKRAFSLMSKYIWGWWD